MKLQKILKEVEDKAEIAALDQAMGNAFKTLGSEYQKNKDAIAQDVKQSDASVKEAVGVVAIIGFILALPRVVELVVTALVKITSVFKKLVKRGEGKQDEVGMATKIIEFTHKWHKLYIKAIQFILRKSGAFDKAQIVGEASQLKAAELVYYTIIAGLAAYSGVGAISAFKAALTQNPDIAANFSIGSLEAAMAGVKSGEVAAFLQKLGLK